MDSELTICDKCGIEILLIESNEGEGDWESATLCNDCYAEEWEESL